MNEKREHKVLAALLTLIISCGVVALLLFGTMSYQWPPKDWHDELAVDQDSIMFGGEYVMLGEIPDFAALNSESSASEQQQQDTQNEPNVEGDDLDDTGKPETEPAQKPLVTAKTPSPMKVKEPEPKKPAPATSSKPDNKNVDNKRAQQASNTTEKKTSGAGNKVSGAFGKNGSGSGKAGSPNGNSTTGNFSGRPGINGLDGFTIAYWGTARSKWTGTVQVRVRVNARGKVIEAHAVGGSGEAWQHPEVRRSCEQGSLNSAFSVSKSRTTEGVGTITWRFV